MINDIDVTILYSGRQVTGFIVDELVTVDKMEPLWYKVARTLGNVKGNVDEEDRQLLKIVYGWADSDLDYAIYLYKENYKKWIFKSKIYGKEKWR